MALAAILCSTDPGAVKDQRQRDFKYLTMTDSPGPSFNYTTNNKKAKNNPFKRKPRGQKSDGSVVQVLEGSGRSQQTKSNGGSGKNQFHSQQRQPRIETFTSGLKENGARFLKSHSFRNVKRNLMDKAKRKVGVEKIKEKVNGSPPPVPGRHRPPDTPLKESSTNCANTEVVPHSPGLNCSISFDSGNGDDLSSSCDSSVILDSAGGVQKCPSNLQLQQMESIASEEEMTPEEDVFLDALSNLSSDDEEFVTPLTSRSTSMTNLAPPTDDEDESQSVVTATTSTNFLNHQQLQESLNEITASEHQESTQVNLCYSSSDLNEPNLKDLCSPLSRNHSECENEEVAETQTGIDTTGLELRPSEDLDNSNKMVVVENASENMPGLLRMPDGLLLTLASNDSSRHESSSSGPEGHKSLPLSPSTPSHPVSAQSKGEVVSSSPRKRKHSLRTRTNTKPRLRAPSDSEILNTTSQSRIYTPMSVSTSCSDSANLPILPEVTDSSCTSDRITSCAPQMHPLYYQWVLWYDKLTTGRPQLSDYAAQLQRVSSISSVEEFWSVFNNLLPPSKLAKNANYHFFKRGIQPLWEDSANKHGGKWVITFKNNSPFLDKVWLEVLMALVGENIEKSDLITGVVLSRRKKGDRVALWTREKKNKQANLHICKQLLDVLCLACGVPESSYDQFVTDLAEDKCGFSIVYMHHKDSMRSGTSYQNEAHLTFKEHLQFMLTRNNCR